MEKQPKLVFEEKDLYKIQEGTLVKVFNKFTPRTAHLKKMCLEKQADNCITLIDQGEGEEVWKYHVTISSLKYLGQTKDELNGSIEIKYRNYTREIFKPNSPQQKRGKEMLIKVNQWEEPVEELK